MAKKLSKKIRQEIKEYVDILKKEIPVQKVIIYGSHARGRARPDSDIDLAIVSSVFGKKYQAAGKYLFRKLWDLKKTRIEPIPYAPSDFRSSKISPL